MKIESTEEGSGFSWLKIAYNGGLLCVWEKTFEFHNNRKFFELSNYQDFWTDSGS